MESPTDLEQTEELFAFLKGDIPEGYRIDDASIPHLTAEQAWTTIWYLSELHWQVSDHIERCDVCENLHDTDSEGTCLDYGKSPHHFCGDCEYGEDYQTKAVANAAKEKP